MNAILLCPGLSLALYDGRTADLTVAVNRAATRHRADLWAAKDWPFVRDHYAQSIGSPRLLTIAASRDHLLGLRFQVADAELFDSITFHVPQWSLFTAPAALVWLYFHGATRIDCWGIDMEGEADFDGVKAGERRTPERWEQERGIWRECVAEIQRGGVIVERHR